MTDFWYTFGALTVKPELLDIIGATNPKFQFIPEIIVENNVPFVSKAAGFLDKNSTSVVRDVIQNYLLSNFPDCDITVSLYTAGKFCQMWNASLMSLKTAIPDANTAFVGANQSLNVTPSKHLLILMGVCLIDDGLTANLTNPSTHDIAKEFFIMPDSASAEWTLLQNWLADLKFAAAQKNLMTNPTWDFGCIQDFVFDPSFIRAAN